MQYVLEEYLNEYLLQYKHFIAREHRTHNLKDILNATIRT